ncbi:MULTISPECIES: hypothetical protein [Sporosarcina]|uniref:Uncharacterized protein n=1 Tax=Sporosarcina contaminans TaxID=633403 RepID=A0ABW3U251_9BACL
MQVLTGLKTSPVTKMYSPQNVQKENEKSANNPVKRDTIMISDEARAQLGNWRERSANMIESLIEKRQKVQEAKSNLIERTLEAGEELSTIKEQLGAFDEQIAEIEEQMAAIEAQKREREKREQEEKQQAAIKTEEAEGMQLTSLLQSAQSLEQVSALKQVKVPLENAHRRLKNEMEYDQGRGSALESKAKKIDELAGRIRSIDSEINNQIIKANESSNEVNRKVSVEEEQDESVHEPLEE